MELEIKDEIDYKQLESVANKINSEYFTGEDVLVSIDSNGGYVEASESISDLLIKMRDAGSNIVTYNTGDCCSAATYIFLMGNARIWNSKYNFVIHLPFFEKVNGNSNELIEMAIDLTNLENDMLDLYSLFSSTPREEIYEIMKQDRPLTVDEIKMLGFATEII